MKICKVEKKREVVHVDYEVCGDKYCCERMKKWLSIGNGYDRKNLYYNIGTEKFSICVKEANHGYDYSGSDDNALYDELDYCPFCGERLQGSQPVTKKQLKKKRWQDAYKGLMSVGKKK